MLPKNPLFPPGSMAKFFSVSLRALKFFGGLTLDHVRTKLSPRQRALLEKHRNAIAAVSSVISAEYAEWHDANRNPTANHPIFLEEVETRVGVLKDVLAEIRKGSAWLLNPSDRLRAKIFSAKGELYQRRCLGLFETLKGHGINISPADPPITLAGGTKVSLLKAARAGTHDFGQAIRAQSAGAEINLDVVIPESINFLGEVFAHMKKSQSAPKDHGRQ